MRKIQIVVGVRPDLIRVAHLLDTLISFDATWQIQVIHTGQHYDPELSQTFIEELGINQLVQLSDVGHGVGVRQMASIMEAYDDILMTDVPDLVLIMGNSNSALACALAARKRGLALGHLDAGLRSYNPGLSEEMNDSLIDRLSKYLFTSSEEAVINLIREGFENTQIIEVGSLRADAILMNLGHAEDSMVLDRFGLEPGRYQLITLHHPETMAKQEFLLELLNLLEERSESLPALFVLHPQSHYLLDELYDLAGVTPLNIQFTESQPYREMLKLLKNAALVITDSQGIQEETTFMGVQCLTVGDSTNRMITLSKGTNTLHSYDIASMRTRISDILGEHLHEALPLTGWDGKTSKRIAEFISGIG